MPRSKNTYLILRELHAVEKDREVALAAENVIDILIKTEEVIQSLIDRYICTVD